MLSPLLCGSFSRKEEEDDDPWSNSPRKSRRSSSRDRKNPFASRGLDKYSELLRELDEKRQKIYAQIGPDDVSLVRFVYSSSNDCVPIIVKLKDHKTKISDENRSTVDLKQKPTTADHDTQVVDKLPIEESVTEKHKSETEETKKNKKMSFLWKHMKLHRWRRPSYYMPVAIILILLLLIFVGRSVTILCTSIGWYLIPTLGSIRPKTSNKVNKRYMRGFSEIKMVNNGLSSSPVRINTGNSFMSPPRHRQSF